MGWDAEDLFYNMYDEIYPYIPISCDYNAAIKNGDRRYGTDGAEFKYDGTDLEDSYLDSKGNICYPSWAKPNVVPESNSEAIPEELNPGVPLNCLDTHSLRYVMLYLAFRSLAIKNKGVSEEQIITAFDQAMKKVALCISETKNSRYEIERLMFINADRLFSQPIFLSPDSTIYTFSKGTTIDPGYAINCLSYFIIESFKNTFTKYAVDVYLDDTIEGQDRARFCTSVILDLDRGGGSYSLIY